LGIFEIILVLVVALIVIPPENLPDVMRATGKILRELRLASNMVVRELGGALDQSPEHHEPVVNTMRPSSVAPSGANIAQSMAPAELKESSDADARPIGTPAELTSVPDESATIAKSADALNGSGDQADAPADASTKRPEQS
jgi:Sec-independent protein translocase protein TatA